MICDLNKKLSNLAYDINFNKTFFVLVWGELNKKYWNFVHANLKNINETQHKKKHQKLWNIKINKVLSPLKKKIFVSIFWLFESKHSFWFMLLLIYFFLYFSKKKNLNTITITQNNQPIWLIIQYCNNA